MELELKHLAPYLPYGLKVLRPDNKTILEIVGLNNNLYIFDEIGKLGNTYGSIKTNTNKPILEPLSNLTKPITRNGVTFVAMDRLECLYTIERSEMYHIRMYIDNGWTTSITELPYDLIQQLIEWKFDVFGLIEKGLAVECTNEYN